jgi:hypothetical protein
MNAPQENKPENRYLAIAIFGILALILAASLIGMVLFV